MKEFKLLANAYTTNDADLTCLYKSDIKTYNSYKMIYNENKLDVYLEKSNFEDTFLITVELSNKPGDRVFDLTVNPKKHHYHYKYIQLREHTFCEECPIKEVMSAAERHCLNVCMERQVSVIPAILQSVRDYCIIANRLKPKLYNAVNANIPFMYDLEGDTDIILDYKVNTELSGWLRKYLEKEESPILNALTLALYHYKPDERDVDHETLYIDSLNFVRDMLYSYDKLYNRLPGDEEHRASLNNMKIYLTGGIVIPINSLQYAIAEALVGKYREQFKDVLSLDLSGKSELIDRDFCKEDIVESRYVKIDKHEEVKPAAVIVKKEKEINIVQDSTYYVETLTPGKHTLFFNVRGLQRKETIRDTKNNALLALDDLRNFEEGKSKKFKTTLAEKIWNKKILKYKETDDLKARIKQLEDLLSIAENHIVDYKDKIDELYTQNNILTNKLNSMSYSTSSTDNNNELWNGETNYFIKQGLEELLKTSVSTRNRRRDAVLKQVVGSIADNQYPEKLTEDLLRLSKQAKSVKELEAGLTTLGFECEYGSSDHLKVYPRGHKELFLIFSNTPSDRTGWYQGMKNLLSMLLK